MSLWNYYISSIFVQVYNCTTKLIYKKKKKKNDIYNLICFLGKQKKMIKLVLFLLPFVARMDFVLVVFVDGVPVPVHSYTSCIA